MSFYGNRTTAAPVQQQQVTAGGTAAAGQTVNYYNKAHSAHLPDGPRDSISQLAWSGEGSFLSCSSWDGSVRLWQVSAGFGTQIQTIPKFCAETSAPLLCLAFGSASNHLFAGSCDKTALFYDLNSNSNVGQIIAQHDQPISGIAWNPIQNVLVTASWDGYLRMWDGKQQQPVWQQSIGGKVFRMALHAPFLGLCDNFRNVMILNLTTIMHSNTQQQQQQQQILKMTPPLQKLQSRSMGFFPDKETETPGVAVGSIEGRVGICHFKNEHRQLNFSFKCHRQETPQGVQIFPVNAIDFHTKHGTFATGGGDGSITVWDKVNRQKLRTFDNMGSCVADVKFDPVGNNLMAYALSYDWHKGPDQQEMAKGHHVYVHVMKDEDLRPRPKTATRR